MPTTATEQYLLELTNDARLNPLADAARYISAYAPLTSAKGDVQGALTQFHVDGAQLLAAFQALAPAQPLAANEALLGGARLHDQAMIAAGTQSHQEAGESDLGTRVHAEGYAYTSAGENIFAYADDMLFAQAGFMVDWGGTPATGGMQSPAGHRVNIMNPGYREAGIGVQAVATPGSPVGPQVVTEDFGTRGTAGSFVLGVAYADTDHDGFYSIGEGRAGLVVSVGAATATSTDSGGYTLSTALVGLQTVQLSGAGLSGPVSVRMALTDAAGAGLNAKIDVVDGSTVRLSNSATLSGAAVAVQLLGLQALTFALGDAVGRTILGNAGNDTLTGGAGNDTITGGAGNDVIDGGAGSNVLDGGAGDNTAVFGFASTAATVTAASDGTGFVVATPGTSNLVHNFQHYRFTDTTLTTLPVPTALPVLVRTYDPGTPTLGPVSVTGSNNVLTIATGDVAVGPGTGNRITLTAGGSVTTVPGAVDTITLGTAEAAVTSGGQDTVIAGSGPVTVKVNTGADIVVGGAGALTFTGGAGNSTVFAGTGGLTYNGSIGADIVVGRGNPIAVTGGSGGGTYFGGGNSTIRAGAGAQAVLVGSNGDSLYSAGAAGDLFGVLGGSVAMDGTASTGNDVFFGAAGTGTLTFLTGSGNDILGLGQGTNLVTLGTGHSTVFANTGTTATSTITAGTGSADIGLGGKSVNLVVQAAGAARSLALFGFVPGADKVTLSGFAAGAAAAALATQSNVGGGTVLTLADHTSIALIGVARADSSLFA